MRLAFPLAVVATCGLTSAQGLAASGDSPGLVTPVTAANPNPTLGTVGEAKPMSKSDLMVPVHTQPDDPAGGRYGTWAAGPLFKASFHDGPAFYPFLGPKYPENLPVKLRTRSLAVGGQELLPAGTQAEHSHTAWRYEYRYPAFTEAYDIREEGVEQTFVLKARPAAAGDLVVKMAVETKLVATSVEERRIAVTFRDAEGNSLVQYGEGTVLDAAGKKGEVLTSWDGRDLSLRVSAAFLASASYPVTIDPLLTRVTIATWGGATFGLPSYPEVGRDDESTTLNVMTFYSRQFSATDFDGYARLTNDNFSGTTTVYTDITTSWSTGRAGVAFSAGTDQWALCLQRDFTTNSGVRIYFHAKGNTTVNSGPTYFHSIPAGATHRYPEIGGTAGFSVGNNVLLVYQSDITATQANTNNSICYGVIVNASTLANGTPFDLDTFAASDDCEYPVVNQESEGGTSSWAVAYQRLDRSIVNDSANIQANIVSYTGAVKGSFFQGHSSSTPTHRLTPQISGRAGRYVVTYILGTSWASTSGQGIYAQRFDWADTAATPTKIAIRTVASDNTTQNFINGGIAYDNVKDSFWGVVYQRGGYTVGRIYAARLGYTGGVVEAVTSYSGPNGGYSPSISFNDDGSKFLLVYGSTDNPPSGYPVYGQEFTYFSTAVNTLYGTGCGGTIGASTPWSGYQYYTVNLTGAAATTPCALLIGGGAAAISLAPAGMPGCFLNVTPILVSLNTLTNGAGAASIPIPIPDAPPAFGDVWFQFVYASPAVPWLLKVSTTRGLRSSVH